MIEAAAIAVVLTIVVVVLSFGVMMVCNSCKHSYERIDTCKDKKMILVCRRCGKIKKLRK